MAKSSGIHLWLVLWKAYDTLRGHAEESIASLQLNWSDFAVLEVLLHKGPLPVNTIGPKVMLTSGSISVAVERLVERNLVERRNDSEDRRTRIVHLTSKGRELIECAFAQHSAAMEQATKGLSKQERASAITLLKKLGQYAESAKQASAVSGS
jgi:MarR family 2-MHQ and catechol resistance regulon transcriptional repressor